MTAPQVAGEDARELFSLLVEFDLERRADGDWHASAEWPEERAVVLKRAMDRLEAELFPELLAAERPLSGSQPIASYHSETFVALTLRICDALETPQQSSELP